MINSKLIDLTLRIFSNNYQDKFKSTHSNNSIVQYSKKNYFEKKNILLYFVIGNTLRLINIEGNIILTLVLEKKSDLFLSCAKKIEIRQLIGPPRLSYINGRR